MGGQMVGAEERQLSNHVVQADPGPSVISVLRLLLIFALIRGFFSGQFGFLTFITTNIFKYQFSIDAIRNKKRHKHARFPLHFQFINSLTYSFIQLFIQLFIYLFIYLFLYLFIYLFPVEPPQRTLQGQTQVPALQRCPHYRCVLIIDVSVLQMCPYYRGVRGVIEVHVCIIEVSAL